MRSSLRWEKKLMLTRWLRRKEGNEDMCGMITSSKSTDKLMLLMKTAESFIARGYMEKVKELQCDISWEEVGGRDSVIVPDIKLKIVMKDDEVKSESKNCICGK